MDVPNLFYMINELGGSQESFSMASSPVILVADDDPVSLRQYELVLKPFLDRIEYFTATNGTDAVRMASLQKPQLVLMDYAMPSMDGLKACQVMRQMELDQDMDIWIISGYSDALDMQLVTKAGANCLISKPIRVIPFREMIANQLNLAYELPLHKAA
jgi:CheY-like chemotaxis protein